MTARPLSSGEDSPLSIDLETAWRTHLGLVREVNEDRLLVLPERGIFAISDGMGGHQRGDIAAQAVVDAIAAGIEQDSGGGQAKAARDALEDVNRRLREAALNRDEGAMMGATVVALILEDDRFSCIWAGDSRAYRWRAGALERITSDHSVTQSLIDQNLIEERDRNRHPQASIITRAIGADREIELETVQGSVQPGDRFLLCSDGISSLVDDPEIAGVLEGAGEQEAVDRLVELVLARGARDNLSVILVSAT